MSTTEMLWRLFAEVLCLLGLVVIVALGIWCNLEPKPSLGYPLDVLIHGVPK